MQRLFVVALTLMALVGVARPAAATTSQIYTYGGAEFYTGSPRPTFYYLCMQVNTGASNTLQSVRCNSSLSTQQFTWDGAHITQVISGQTLCLTNDTTLKMETCTYATNQDWLQDGSLLKANNGAGSCLTVNGGQTGLTQTPAIDVETCAGTGDQTFWTPSDPTAWTFRLMNANGKYLTESSGSITVAVADYTNDQKWYFTNTFQIANLSTGHCMQVNSGNTLSPVSCDSTTTWSIGQQTSTYANYAFFEVTNAGTCLTAAATGSGVSVTTCSSTAAGQAWLQP